MSARARAEIIARGGTPTETISRPGQPNSVDTSRSSVGSLNSQLGGLIDQANRLGINTGQAQSVFDQTKAQGSTPYAGSAAQKAFSATQLGSSATPANIPSYPTSSNPGDIVGANNNSIASLLGSDYKLQNNQFVYDPSKTAAENATVQANQGMMQNLLSKLGLQSQLPDSAQLYKDTYGINEAQTQRDYQQARADVRNQTATLNGIVAKQQADLLALRGTGSNNGVTEAVYGGQQAQINREAAIAALPVQAQLSASQGNLQEAKSNLDNLFKLKSEDAQTRFKFTSDLVNSVIDVANQGQQNLLNVKLNEIKKTEDIATQNRAYMHDLAIKAAENGRSGLISSITALDPTSPNFEAKYQALAGQALAPKPTGIKAPDLQNFGTSASPDWRQYNRTTGMWENVPGIAGTNAPNQDLVKAQAVKNVQDITDVLGNRALSTAVGTSWLTRGEGGWGSLLKSLTVVGAPNGLNAIYNNLTGKQQEFISGINQIASQLTLDKLVQAKQNGATFGALSDGERQMLANSATKLGTWAVHEGGDPNKPVVGFNTNESALKKELFTIQNFARIDALNRGVDPKDIGAVPHADGTVWVRNPDGSYSQIK